LGAVRSIAEVVTEVDVRPARASAERPFRLAVVSRDLPLARHLASLLYRGPRAQEVPAAAACDALALDGADRMQRYDLVVVVAREDLAPPDAEDAPEVRLAREMDHAGIPVLAFLISEPGAPPPLRHHWLPAAVVAAKTLAPGSDVLDDAETAKELVRGIRSLKAVDDLALARHLPAFRPAVCQTLIEENAIANAVYSTGTGVLEINPLLGIPLTMTDLIVLTKNQAILSYKIALAMGMTADFRQIMPQLAAVVGTGFLYRQIARTLVGLVPGWGVAPKVAVAFAGTYVTGEAIYAWCATGEKLTGEKLKQVYDAAIARGRSFASALAERWRARRPKREVPLPLPLPPTAQPPPAQPPPAQPPQPPTSPSPRDL
jgi:uncharacterized protein (DUF697 family)